MHLYCRGACAPQPETMVRELGPNPYYRSRVLVQAAQRDLEYAEAIAARFPEGSALGPERDAAEEKHAVAVAAIGARLSRKQLYSGTL